MSSGQRVETTTDEIADRQTRYLQVLGWAFAFFNTTRVVAYLPTIAAIHSSADSGQHSLWTWWMWTGANLTMGLWLYEHNQRRFNRVICVNLLNAMMCAVTVVSIVWYRW